MNTQEFAFGTVQSHPHLLVDLLDSTEDTTWLIKKTGDKITIVPYPAYSRDVVQLVAEARTIYEAKKTQGYNREAAKRDFAEAKSHIDQLLSQQ